MQKFMLIVVICFFLIGNITKLMCQQTDYAVLNLTYNNILTISSGIYAYSSNRNTIYGRLIYANSSSTSNITDNDNEGCSPYKNSFLPSIYVALVTKGKCSYQDQIKNAILSNASGLIINTFAESDLGNSDNGIIFENMGPLVVVLVSKLVGTYLNLTLVNNSQVFVSIEIRKENNIQVNTPKIINNDLSATSITFIVLGSMGFVLLISAMWVIFYIIQRSRSIEERQRLEELIQHLTKRAISKMKLKKIKNGNIDFFSNEKCVICLDSFQAKDVVRQLPCSHYFHKKEIDTWLYLNQTCPVCKVNVLKAYGLNISSKSSCFQRTLERLNLVHSPIEVNEAILSQMDERRDVYSSIQSNSYQPRFSIFSAFNRANSTSNTNNNNTLNSISNITSANQNQIRTFEEVNTLERRNSRYSEFQNIHLKNAPPDADEQQQSSIKAKIGKRLTFFGEKLEDKEILETLSDNEKNFKSSKKYNLSKDLNEEKPKTTFNKLNIFQYHGNDMANSNNSKRISSLTQISKSAFEKTETKKSNANTHQNQHKDDSKLSIIENEYEDDIIVTDSFTNKTEIGPKTTEAKHDDTSRSESMRSKTNVSSNNDSIIIDLSPSKPASNANN